MEVFDPEAMFLTRVTWFAEKYDLTIEFEDVDGAGSMAINFTDMDLDPVCYPEQYEDFMSIIDEFWEYLR
jgi:hypothetical protein